MVNAEFRAVFNILIGGGIAQLGPMSSPTTEEQYAQFTPRCQATNGPFQKKIMYMMANRNRMFSFLTSCCFGEMATLLQVQTVEQAMPSSIHPDSYCKLFNKTYLLVWFLNIS